MAPSGRPSLSLARRAGLRLAAAAMLGPTACGGPGPYAGALYPVTGQVLLADGQPLTGGTVQFIPRLGGLSASGRIGPDGTFTLKSLKTREGAAPGEYKVRIEPTPGKRPRRGKSAKKPPFAPRYREYDGETGLTATIPAGPTRLPAFRLDAE